MLGITADNKLAVGLRDLGSNSGCVMNRSIICSVSFGNSDPSSSKRHSSFNASSYTASSAKVSLNCCWSFNLFSAVCSSSIAFLNLIFCSNEARLAFTLIRVCFEESNLPDEADLLDGVLERFVLRDNVDRTYAVSSLSRDASLLNAALRAP